MTISVDDVRRLVEADTDSVLVLLEGRTEVISADQLDDHEHLGALQLISRADLLERIGTSDVSEHQLAEQAGALDAAVSELGG